MRQGSIDDINLDQFLKISNYEDTVKQLDIYYGIGKKELALVALINTFWYFVLPFLRLHLQVFILWSLGLTNRKRDYLPSLVRYSFR